jgi:4'-phosphopantetheinyl transferase EntD
MRWALRLRYRYVSASHSGAWYVVVASGRPVAVDIERLRRRHSAFDAFVASASEHSLLPEVEHLPVVAWSVKEACYKLCRTHTEPSQHVITSRVSDRTVAVACGGRMLRAEILTDLRANYVVVIARENALDMR